MLAFMALLLWSGIGSGSVGLVTADYIRPGSPTAPHWNDTDGNRIEAHAAGLFFDDPTQRWYWYGESQKTDDLRTHGVNCYSSQKLVGPWKFESQVLSQKDISDGGGPFVVERPKVLYNNLTKMYVMWFHLDNSGYTYRHAAVAVSPTPNGHFRYLYSLKPDGIPSLDMSLFLDPLDQKGYFIRSCDNSYVGISLLTDDYLNTTGIISTHDVFEGMALFRLPNGTYYVITSHLTGWAPNPLMLFRAAGPSLHDPQWVDMGNPTGDQQSFFSQPTYVVSQTDKKGQLYWIYLGDNWVHGDPTGQLINASYIWLPMEFSDTNITIPWRWEWDPEDPFAPTPPPPAPPACGLPTLQQRLHLRPCNSSDPSQAWSVNTVNPSNISLRSYPKLCIDSYGQDPSTQQPAVAVLSCDGSSANQRFTYGSDQTLRRASDGRCLDVTFCGDTPCAGDPLELYSCGSPHENQNFVYDAGTGLLHIVFDNTLCVAACHA